MDRRNFIKAGIGAMGALNCSLQATPTTPVKMKKKLIISTVALGFFDDLMIPQKRGDLNSSKLLKVLHKHHNHMTYLQGITQPEIGNGHIKGKGLLTCNRNQTNGPYISVDQFIGDRIVQEARYKTFNMGGPIWNKYSRTVPSYFEKGLKETYDALFTNTIDNDLLNANLHTVNELRRKSQGISESTKVYNRSLNDLKNELNTNLLWSKKAIKKPDFEPTMALSDAHDRGLPKPYEQHLNLARHAIQNERAQIVTVAAPFIDDTKLIGASASYHGAGHGARKSSTAMTNLHKIENYLMEDFAKFLDGLVESGGLDDCMVVLIGGFNDAGAHKRHTIPCLIVGGGFKHHGVMDCTNKYRLSQLYVSLTNQAGIDIDEFAGFKGSMNEVLL